MEFAAGTLLITISTHRRCQISHPSQTLKVQTLLVCVLKVVLSSWVSERGTDESLGVSVVCSASVGQCTSPRDPQMYHDVREILLQKAVQKDKVLYFVHLVWGINIEVYRAQLNFPVDTEGAWSDKEHKLLIGRFNFYKIKKTIGAFKDVQREIWPDLKLIDDGFQCIFVPNTCAFLLLSFAENGL